MTTKTTKKELIDSITESTGVKKSGAELVLNATLAEIERALLAGQPVTLHGFGTFELKKRDARTGRNPRTGEPVEIAASTSVAFKPAKALKDSLN
jgi:DNA-binding protein HU-beta